MTHDGKELPKKVVHSIENLENIMKSFVKDMYDASSKEEFQEFLDCFKDMDHQSPLYREIFGPYL